MRIIKKAISVMMIILLLSTMIVLDFSVFAKEAQPDINDFISGIKDLAQEYDADKDFEVTEETDDTFNTSSVDENETSILDENAFQTARLIVRANGDFNDFGAVEHIKGFKNFHILQYKTEEAAKEAYKKLGALSTIVSVAPDEVVDATTSVTTASTVYDDPPEDGKYLCNWSHDRTQSDRLLDYIENNNIQLNEVTVAVIDTGVDLEHEFLKNRIIRSYFNSSASGNANNEYDSVNGHGTAVSSVIVDNTPDNVKVSVYRAINNAGGGTISGICAAYLQAVEDEVDVVNASLGYEDWSGLTEECVKAGYLKNIPFFVSASNAATYGWIDYPGLSPYSITVGATNKYNNIADFSTKTATCDISAPGEDIVCARPNNKYEIMDGTSFSAPFAAALGAIIKSKTPNITVESLENLLKDTSVDVKTRFSWYDFNNAVEERDVFFADGEGMVQFCDAFGIDDLAVLQANLSDDVYVGKQECVLTCSDENAVILYSVGRKYPSYETAQTYTEPIEVTETTTIKAVAYYPENDYYGKLLDITPRVHTQGADEDFAISSAGVVLKYTGTETQLYVPDVIKGITVAGIQAGTFSRTSVASLYLSDNITEIPANMFNRSLSNTIEYIYGRGVETIGESAFDELDNLIRVDFPSVKLVGERAFYNVISLVSFDFNSVETVGDDAFKSTRLHQINAPNLESIATGAFSYTEYLINCDFPNLEYNGTVNGAPWCFKASRLFAGFSAPKIKCITNEMFYNTEIRYADFPNAETVEAHAFYRCTFLKVINLPNVNLIPSNTFMDTITEPQEYLRLIGNKKYFLDNTVIIEADAFGTTATERIEFSHLETTHSLPNNGGLDYGTILMMPSTFKECTEDTTGRNYRVYGTRGTYAEEWAHEYGHTFIEVTPETAIINDVDEEYNVLKEPLVADVAGFNKTYQWYASDIDSNKYGTPIEGATSRTFNPEDYPYAHYYYCVVTSTDVGYDPITITTGVCENTLYEAPEKSCITNVTYEPSRETRNTFTVTVDNRPAMIQFIEPDGGTRTYDRNNKNVSIKSYDAEGNEVNSLDRNLTYEVWDIYSNMSAGVRIKTRAKYLNDAIYSWDKITYDFVPDLLPLDYTVRSVTPISESGRFGAVQATVVTGPDAEGIRFLMPDGSTTTYLSDKATTLDNGDLKFIGTAWANNLGVNVIKVEVKVGGKWKYATAFRYDANDYPVSA